MAEPPRLPVILLPWEKSIIYFVTICVKDRRKVLATPEVFGAIKIVIAQLHKWYVLAGVIMPDHVHILLRKHRHQAEEMIEALKHASRARLCAMNLRTADHPTWASGWVVVAETW